MHNAYVVSIHVADVESGPMRTVDAVRAVPGAGLEGDRYFAAPGSGRDTTPDQEVTLIEVEALEALQRDYSIEMAPGESRRNLLTRGVALNHLVGQRFRIGGALLRGVELCEPCSHLVKLTGKKVLRGLVHRGGLRAQILAEGEIKAGDAIVSVDGHGI
jgi:MOSC domain-containing protein YiiM